MPTSKILFIGKKFLSSPSGGREMLSHLTFKIIKKILKDHCFNYELDSFSNDYPKPSLKEKIFDGHIDGISPLMIQDIRDIIRLNNISQVFIDGSNLGFFAEKIKKQFPEVNIICFFHNVEAKFFFDSLIRQKSLKSFAVLVANFFSERKAVKNSDHNIALTSSDSKNLRKIYGKFADSIFPMAIDDKFQPSLLSSTKKSSERYILFVGGKFYANEFGVRWFAKNVSPYIDYKTFVIGRGFENLQNELEQYKNVKILGEVDILSEWYMNAEYVIAPIFEGSGMKTKVAEALMYGKKIIATTSALIGYENLPDDSYYVCNTKKEFIELFSLLYSKIPEKFDNNLRKIYLKQYSQKASKKRLKKIL